MTSSSSPLVSAIRLTVEADGSLGFPPEARPHVRALASEICFPAVRRAMRPSDDGWVLPWERLDLERRVLRREEFSLEQGLYLDARQEDGLFLVLASAGSIWFPAQPGALPNSPALGRLSWRYDDAELTWSYRRRSEGPELLVEWSFHELPAHWVIAVQNGGGEFACETPLLPSFPLRLHAGSGLAASGRVMVPPDGPLPLRRRFVVAAPLRRIGDGGGGNDAGETEATATVPVFTLSALVDGVGETQWIADADLRNPFRVVLVTEADVELPARIESAFWPAVGCELEVTRDAPLVGDRPDARHRAWLLEPRFGEEVRWGTVDWGTAERLTFPGQDGAGAPDTSIRRVAERTARIAWQLHPVPVRGPEDGGVSRPLSLVTPFAVPSVEGASWPPHTAVLELEHGRTFRIGSGRYFEHIPMGDAVELPRERIVLGPDDWAMHTETGVAVTDRIVLGEVGGYVRWQLPAELRRPSHSPAQWAVGRGPVFLARESRSAAEAWGGLYVPFAGALGTERGYPGQLEQEVRPHAREGEAGVFLTARRVSRVWLSLWGYVDRYERVELTFPRRAPVTAWIAAAGLPLFPPLYRQVLRAFAPVHAMVEDGCDFTVLPPASIRPAVIIGRDVVSGGKLEIVPREEALLRIAVHTPTPVSMAPSSFGIPLFVDQPAIRTLQDGNEVWIAVQNPVRGDTARQSGILLAWSKDGGWMLRGFFAGLDGVAWLGSVHREGREGDAAMHAVFLETGRAPVFTGTVTDQVDWSGNPPEAVKNLEQGLIFTWIEEGGTARRNAPAALAGYESRRSAEGDRLVIDFFEDAAPVPERLPIRAWEPATGPVEPAVSAVSAVRGGSESMEATKPAESAEFPGPSEPMERGDAPGEG